ncbi:thiamine-phosphate kinase [Nitrosomonas ureae]|uniref:Thiamine-monophosphate kinase n=1 Tax=Nitrosomonas ureae TaxID=44577 RepID=A0A1H2HNK8_9PROT|nr:AIR synthase related protein [Nitrosomonas ureae]SDU33128.1 thiamine-monophosphate kinase [Nitrosomonas ureae]
MLTLEQNVSDFGEIRLLSEILLQDVTGRAGEKNDDCAHLDISGKHLLWSIDPCPTPVASWFGKASAEVWGCYTATINLSDIAASGGTPIGMLVSLELPDDTSINFIRGFQSGLIATLYAAGATLLGGNVKSAKKFGATGTIIGNAGKKRITRLISNNNCVAYLVGNSGNFWTAVIGNYFGWNGLSIDYQASLNTSLCFPRAQIEAGKIIGNLPFELACMDCSDGPANALFQLAQLNSLDIKLLPNPAWPLQSEYIHLLNEHNINIENACYQFGDWQLLCLIPSNECVLFENILHGLPVTKIGYATQGSGTVLHEDGRRLMETSLNQNFSGGYNSIENIEELLSRFMYLPIFR